MADWIFKFNNLGVCDIQTAISQFIKEMFNGANVFLMMNEMEMIEWVWKLYFKMVQVSGIKGKQSKKWTDES